MKTGMYEATCDVCNKSFQKDTQPKADAALRMHMISHKDAEQARDKETKTDQIPAHLTPEERAIVERVKSQDEREDDWFAIGEESMNDFSLMVNPFDLPPEAAKLQKEKVYAFRYCERTPQRIDELTRAVNPPLRWKLVTRSSMPVMAKYVDDINGCVCKLDQALLFKPWSHHEMVKEAKQALANATDRSGILSGKKDELQSKDADIQVFEGREHKISSKDEVIADEAAMDASDESGLGELVIE